MMQMDKHNQHLGFVIGSRRRSGSGLCIPLLQQGEELSWSEAYGPRTFAWLLKPAGISEKLPSQRKLQTKVNKNRHESKQPTTLESMLKLDEETGLDKQQFGQDLHSQESRAHLAQEHQEAISQDISATPTFCFESGAAAYLRFLELPEGKEDTVQFFLDYRQMIERYPYLQTIRRPYKRS